MVRGTSIGRWTLSSASGQIRDATTAGPSIPLTLGWVDASPSPDDATTPSGTPGTVASATIYP